MTVAQNHFELFELPVAFRIDESLLESRYLGLQALLHPDRHINAGEREQRLMAVKSAAVNEAYRVLSDACSRAAYLLQTAGLALDSEKDTTADGEFLLRQMELEEAIEAAADKGSVADAAKLLDDISQRLTDMRDCFELAWQARDLEAAREAMLKMKFLDKARAKAAGLAKRMGAKDELVATG